MIESRKAQRETIRKMYDLSNNELPNVKVSAIETLCVVCSEEQQAETRLNRKSQQLIEFQSKIKRQVANRQ